MAEVPYDPVAELQPVTTEHGIEDGIQRNDLAVVDVVPDLPADRSLRMESTRTHSPITRSWESQVVVERGLVLVVLAQVVGRRK